ncbi:helix-turn-helix domain-containing protein [Bacillus piscicola]|uniref:helix-turn-helix domain-containing protein n=1 Tax=Bacillus piscicola TaxID=1632684 RepID=UPI001F0993CE|nr:XRE family transcriptional regulator [Bacillus piscicola]
METNTHFGKRLKNLRQQRRLSQIDLGSAIGVSQATIASYESGGRRPRYSRILTIAEYFSISPNALLGYKSGRRAIDGLLTVPVYKFLPAHVKIGDKKHLHHYSYLPEDGRYKEDKVFMLNNLDEAMSSRIQKGDSLVVTVTDTIEEGVPFVVHIHKEKATIRRIYQEERTNSFILTADHPDYPPHLLKREEFLIRGKVSQVIFEPR